MQGTEFTAVPLPTTPLFHLLIVVLCNTLAMLFHDILCNWQMVCNCVNMWCLGSFCRPKINPSLSQKPNNAQKYVILNAINPLKNSPKFLSGCFLVLVMLSYLQCLTMFCFSLSQWSYHYTCHIGQLQAFYAMLCFAVSMGLYLKLKGSTSEFFTVR